MSDFFNPQKNRLARKAHQCTYCAEEINVGDCYVHQTGVYRGQWQSSKLHPECFEDLTESGDDEYEQYGNERPVLSPNRHTYRPAQTIIEAKK